MHLSADISSALQQIEAVKQGIDECDDEKLQMNTAESLKTILDILQDPVFRQIIHVQDSLSELNTQIAQHPSMLPNDFDIDVSGNLVISVPSDVMYEIDYNADEQRVPSSTNLSPRSLRSPHSNGESGQFIDLGSIDMPILDEQNHSSSTSMKKSRGFTDLTRHNDEDRPQSAISSSLGESTKINNADLYSSTDYIQIQALELVNDGTGLGFGIIGARTSGVIVKTILQGGVADRDGRLKSGDHILQIGDVNLHEMVSDQVASVLRQSGTHVRLVVARPVLDSQIHNHTQYGLEPGTAIVPSRVMVDPVELERYLIASGYPEIFGESSCASTPHTNTEDERFIYRTDKSDLIDIAQRPPIATPNMEFRDIMDELPETEKFQLELTKDSNGLGITIAGYVCEKEELSGIFVKSVSAGSAADMSGKIRVNDRIIEVDGQSLQGFSNHQAVESLKKSGKVVNLRLERYLRGPKYEQLQQAIADNDKIPSSIPSTPSRSLPPLPINPQSSEELSISEVHSDISSTLSMEKKHLVVETALSSFGSGKKLINSREETIMKIVPAEVSIDHDDTISLQNSFHTDELDSKFGKHKYFVEPNLTTEIESEIIQKWRMIVGLEVKIIVAQIRKFASSSGLGISLEGTVDVEGGKEVRPHHYIRSILPEGPVGQNGCLKSGDELLEVNKQRLLGMNHLEVVAILKELPQDIRMVCSRGRPTTVIQTSPNTSCIGGSMKKLNSNLDNLLPTSADRLVKAKSDGSLATTSTTNYVGGVCGDTDDSFNTKLKSRSLEPLTGLAMWSSEPQMIELIKGDRGLGFSILDYQDPIDPNDTLIVIRSLVPGGVAQIDGRLIPGDRLLFVNNINLENASLDQAVQALKGATKGVVQIGVAKPLPMTDNSLKLITSGPAEISGISNASTVDPDVIGNWNK